jgi:hypothetical protein
MRHCVQVLIPPESDPQPAKAIDRSGPSIPIDPVEGLASLDAPTVDINQMLLEIEAGRI